MEERPERGLPLKPDLCKERGGGFLIVPLKNILTPILRSRYGGDCRGMGFTQNPVLNVNPPKE